LGVPLACKTLAILIIGIAPISGLACALCCAHCRADSGAPPRSGASGKVYGHRLLHRALRSFYEGCDVRNAMRNAVAMLRCNAKEH